MTRSLLSAVEARRDFDARNSLPLKGGEIEWGSLEKADPHLDPPPFRGREVRAVSITPSRHTHR